MGHRRLGEMPRIGYWPDVIKTLDLSDDPAQIANVTAKAARKGLEAAGQCEPGSGLRAGGRVAGFHRRARSGHDAGTSLRTQWAGKGKDAARPSSKRLEGVTTMPRIQNWTKLTDKELWAQWQTMFISEEEALATAIWIGNRLVKNREKSTRRKFYSLKDEWIIRHQGELIIGKVVRDESQGCWTCGGTGQQTKTQCPRCYGDGTELGFDESESEVECPTCDGKGYFEAGPCRRCGGSGLHRISILYEHLFDIDGTHYTFHSYVKPEHLCEELGADCETYGGRFSQDELNEMALPVTGILRLLGYVAKNTWEMQFDRMSGRYV
jgi:hypothetical protein